MIMGDCPYPCCDGMVWEAIADRVRWQKHDCETCHRTIWTFHSRVTPLSLTDADFRAQYDVDDATKRITEKVGA